jgi:hypothetical protein
VIDMSASFTRSLIVLSALGSIVVSRPARADEPESERLFHEGRALMLEGRFAEACPKLEESQRIEPRGGTLLNLAACHERQGRIATAWLEFHDALGAARAEGQAARARLAEERIAALRPRLPWITILVAPEADAQGVRVTLDGKPVARAAWGKEMPIDPGDHLFVVSATGRVEHRSTIAAREGLRQVLEVKGLAELPPPPPPAEPPPAEPAPAEPPVEPAAPVAPPPASGYRFGRWVFEIGAFGGYIASKTRSAKPDVGEDGILLASLSPERPEPSSCDYLGCTYGAPRGGAFVGGVSLFAGFAATENIHVGGRILAGPRLQGGALFATGPSVSIHVGGRFWAGASMLLGYASASGNAEVTPPPTHTLVDNSLYRVTGSTDVAFGLGVELRMELWRTSYGALALDTQPLFLAGADGSAFVLPFGISYRFR